MKIFAPCWLVVALACPIDTLLAGDCLCTLYWLVGVFVHLYLISCRFFISYFILIRFGLSFELLHTFKGEAAEDGYGRSIAMSDNNNVL